MDFIKTDEFHSIQVLKHFESQISESNCSLCSFPKTQKRGELMRYLGALHILQTHKTTRV